ncbi:MAG: tRNA (adenosine(37)-N6)-dimethylallyltransferase MiaA [Candidatus Symbiothrix sp.]|nr:tRNA (adenosine(37)-N6)-dimethylallyltransferase MiaA [Candidatus Symbiothrix sp.]
MGETRMNRACHSRVGGNPPQIIPVLQTSSCPELTTVLGPTASGKTAFAVKLAHKLDAEIISADSRQVYRGMTIGTGKDLGDYRVGDREIPYHLIDICDAGEKYNVYHFQNDFHAVFADIKARGKKAILCGGSGLYIESVLRGYDFPDVPKTPEQTAYPSVDSLILGIDIDRDLRRQKISKRLDDRLQEGLIEEVQTLLASGLSPEDLMYYGLEYRFVTLHVIGKLTFQEMHDHLEIAIHQFAKRQMTWFRGMERRGFTIQWVDPTKLIGV